MVLSFEIDFCIISKYVFTPLPLLLKVFSGRDILAINLFCKIKFLISLYLLFVLQDCLLIYVHESGKNDGFNLVNAIRMSLRVYNNLNCTSSADIKMKIRKCQKILHDSRTNINEIISMEERFHNEMKQKLESAQNYVIELLDYVFDDNTQHKKSDYENSIRRVIKYLKVKNEKITAKPLKNNIFDIIFLTKDNIKKHRHDVNLDVELKISDIDSLLFDKSWRKKYCEEEKE